jgi:hypothetical protein
MDRGSDVSERLIQATGCALDVVNGGISVSEWLVELPKHLTIDSGRLIKGLSRVLRGPGPF